MFKNIIYSLEKNNRFFVINFIEGQRRKLFRNFVGTTTSAFKEKKNQLFIEKFCCPEKAQRS